MSIKTLSPSFKFIPFVSPFSGLISTSYKLQIFVWRGLKTSEPTTPLFEITKNNATGSSGTDEINISRLVNSFFDFTIQTSSGVTQLLDGNNQAWVRTVVFYTTADVSELTLGQLIDVDLMLKGYGYGFEGKNPQTPSNNVLIPNNSYNVDRIKGRFVVPIALDEISNTIDAVNDTANIFFQDTIIDVLANDNLGFEPTVIFTLDDSTFPSTAGTLSIVGATIKYNVGTVLATPLTATYTIKDITGATDTATLTINVSALPSVVTAVDDFYEVNNVDTVNLTVQDNDVEGTPPTTITAVVQTGITSGTITIDGTNEFLIFTPNGVIPVSDETFTYDLTDTITTDTGTVTLHVISDAAPGSFNMQTTGSISGGAACLQPLDIIRFHDGSNALPEDGDTIFANEAHTIVFTGGDLFYKVEDNQFIQVENDGFVKGILPC